MNSPAVQNGNWDITPYQEDNIEESGKSPNEEAVELYALDLSFLTHR